MMLFSACSNASWYKPEQIDLSYLSQMKTYFRLLAVLAVFSFVFVAFRSSRFAPISKNSLVRIDTISIDQFASTLSCERHRISKKFNRNSNDGQVSISISANDIDMTFTKQGKVMSGAWLLRAGKFAGGVFDLNLSDILNPSVWASRTGTKLQRGTLNILSFDSKDVEAGFMRAYVEIQFPDTSGKISFPVQATYMDKNLYPSELRGDFPIDAVAWKLFPRDTTQEIVKDDLMFHLKLVTKK
ncbi:MAG: hypothetical protein ACRCYO_18870 [Bacteroidia bacterium]